MWGDTCSLSLLCNEEWQWYFFPNNSLNIIIGPSRNHGILASNLQEKQRWIHWAVNFLRFESDIHFGGKRFWRNALRVHGRAPSIKVENAWFRESFVAEYLLWMDCVSLWRSSTGLWRAIEMWFKAFCTKTSFTGVHWVRALIKHYCSSYGVFINDVYILQICWLPPQGQLH